MDLPPAAVSFEFVLFHNHFIFIVCWLTHAQQLKRLSNIPALSPALCKIISYTGGVEREISNENIVPLTLRAATATATAATTTCIRNNFAKGRGKSRNVPQSFYFHSVLADTCSTIKTIV